MAREEERPALAEPGTGGGLVRADEVGTAALVVAAIAGVVAPSAFTLPLVVVSLVLFFAGMATFLWAYAVAVGRSRTDAIGMGGLFFLAGSTPAAVRRRMMALLAAQVVVGLAAASLRPFTGVAFAVLAPMYGLGLAGLWGARHGAFPPRVAAGGRAARTAAPDAAEGDGTEPPAGGDEGDATSPGGDGAR